MRDPVRIIIWTLAVIVVAMTVLSFGDRLVLGGRPGWVLDLLSHWPRHLALAGVFVGAVAIWRRMRVTGIAALAAGAINIALAIGLGGFALPQAAPADARLIRIVSANVHGSMPALEKVAKLARDCGADVVAVYEVPEDLTVEQFDGLFPELSMRSLPSTRKSNGWALIRRSAMAVRQAAGIETSTYDGSHGVLMSTNVRGVVITSTHPPSPGDPGLKADRDRQLSDIAIGVDVTRPFIIAGDFNSTPWGRAYGTVPGTRAGDPRFEGTFPAFLGPLGLPIDHIKFGGGLVLIDYRAGPDIGSDHLPLFATFALPAR